MFRFRLDQAKYCNCARCNMELLGASQREVIELAIEEGQIIRVPIVAGRIRDGERHAPYCEWCLEIVEGPLITPPPAHCGITPRQGAKLGSTTS